ncbi:MAG: ComEC/Rec2 family competence protein [Marinilabiliales bacterium]|nr:ComEC/Rec2 family competence protein [Marinilabiliales bacterium]
MSGEELGLVTALTIGDKDLLDKEQLTSFSRTGAMHIMAVSGLHVGMISLGLSGMLFFLRGRIQDHQVAHNYACPVGICLHHGHVAFGTCGPQ